MVAEQFASFLHEVQHDTGMSWPFFDGYIQLVPRHQNWFSNFISVAACKTDRVNKASDESGIELTKETSISLEFEVRKDLGI